VSFQTAAPHSGTLPMDKERGRNNQIKNLTLKDAVKVYDVLGNVVLSSPACSAGTPSEGGHIRLDVSNLAAGVYFVRVGGKMYRFVKM